MVSQWRFDDCEHKTNTEQTPNSWPFINIARRQTSQKRPCKIGKKREAPTANQAWQKKGG